MKTATQLQSFKTLLYLVILVISLPVFSQVQQAFTPRYNETVRGDVTMIANNMLSRSATQNYNGERGNHDFTDNVYVDIDNDITTFNSSSANFTNPDPSIACLSIKKAYLYWAAADKEPDINDLNSENQPGWNYNDIKLMLPGETVYTTLTADEVIFRGRDIINHFSNDPYVCLKDITSSVVGLSNPYGTYQVANVEAKLGSVMGHPSGTVGTSGGWQIVFVYESPSLPTKNISLFDGYAHVMQTVNNFDINFNGFQTVPFGPVSADVIIGSLEGDRDLSGDKLQIQNVANNFVDITAPSRTATNFFNSRITIGNSDFLDRIPASQNTLGFDAALFNLDNPSNAIIGNNQTSATIRLTSDQETYGLFLLGFSVDVWAPDLNPIEMMLTSGSNPANPGDTIGFEFQILNTGNDNAVNVQIAANLPEQIEFMPNNLPSGVTYTFDTVTRDLIFFVADNLVDIGSPPLTIDLNFIIKEECYFLEENCVDSVELQFEATYNGVLNPSQQITLSSDNLDACEVGTEEPNIININRPDEAIWANPIGDLDRTVNCTDSSALSAAQTLEPTTDKCNFIYTKTSGNFVQDSSCPSNGTYTNTWVFTDSCGRTSDPYVQTITVVDTTPPTITAPIDVTIECNDDESSANTGLAIASDSCGSVTITEADVETAACGNTKTIIRTFTATDDCGNTASASQTITVVDTTPPTITAPIDVTIECNDDESSANTGLATASDFCGSVTITEADVETAACGNTKTIIRTFTATDDCGNTASASQTITVVDTTPPTITAPIDVTIECNDDESSANTGLATASDSCGSVTITEADVETAACGNTKTILRTFTATDDCGNTASASQTITVVDTTPPTITAPIDVTIECNDDESSANTGLATASDSCGSVTITEADVETAACGNTKTIIRTFTATDDCGNTASASQTITVVDTTPPTITAPIDVTIECNDDESSANTGLAIASDSCGSVTITEADVETAACGNTKTILRTFTATDDCGNTASASQTITVVDTTPPTITAPIDVTIECNDDESSANTGLAIASDSCGSVTITEADVETAACGNTKTIIRTFTATDDCGNTASASQTITVVDTTPPTITAPIDVTIECNDDESSANTGLAIASDSCGSVTITEADVETAACGNTKTIIRTFTATDDCGNTASASQTITVVDTTPPTITAPIDVTIECNDDESSANTGLAIASDSCGSVTITEADVETAACGNTKTILRTFTATDDCGNTASASQTITVVDTTPPTITAPIDVTIECNDDESSANTGLAIASDSCGSVTITEADVETAACGNTKTIIRTFTATDDCGNTASASQTITVVDTTPPTITAPIDVTIECNDDESSANTGLAIASDSCGSVTITEADVETAACGNTKTIIRTFTAIDDCGNTASASQTITVVDTTPPVIDNSGIQNIDIQCGITPDSVLENWILTNAGATANDSCDDDITWSNNYNPNIDFDCDNGPITVVFTATDSCGNTASTSATYEILDTKDPVLTLPVDITIECGEDSSPMSTGMATAIDDCTSPVVSYEDTEVESCGNTTLITRIWTASDLCGNTDTGEQIITVIDTTGPTFTVPTDITLECSTDINDVMITGDVIDESDNCDSNLEATYSDSITAGSCANASSITRTWTLTDSCNNTTTAVQIITLIDTTAPEFNEILPQDITVECDQVPDAATLTITDNCGDATLSFNETIILGDCVGSYSIERTWIGIDQCTNETVHTQIITVQDTTAPTLVNNLEENITVACDAIPQAPDLVFQDECSSNITVSFMEESNQTNDFEDYSIVRTWNVADDCGNEATFVQTITVEINNIINAFDSRRCTLDPEFDLFDLLSGDFDMDGTWSVVSGDATINGSLFDPSSVDLGVYTFLYSITEGSCPGDIEVNVTVDDDCVVLACGRENIIIPKTVTANGDDINDVFIIEGIDNCGFVIELQIYNRWGAKIYESNNYQQDWGGTAHGSSIGGSGLVPTGTYYYVIKLRNSGLEPFVGPIYVATNK